MLSPVAYNKKVGLLITCPVTSQVKGYPFEVRLPHGLGVTGVILSDQVKSLDWIAREAAFICSLPAATINEVLRKVRLLLE